ncbi:MAG: LysM peptidoglycan-binding domain-containing protein, partial [Candidatus Margulisiibacteriota bacterium]
MRQIKRIMAQIILLSAIALTAVSANAAVYAVRQGDSLSLSKIGKTHNLTWQAIAKANKKISNQDKIYPGQELQIPVKGKSLGAAKAKSKKFSLKKEIRIKSLGVKPFGRSRDPIKAIKKFRLPEEVKNN